MKTIKFAILFIALLCLPEIAISVERSWYQKAHIGGNARHRSTGFSIGNKGYFGGGHINSGVTETYKDYWEYDPATDSWTQIADFAGGMRYHSSAFSIGNAAYVGCGENATNDYTNDFWKYVPEVNTWFPIAPFPGTPRRGGTAFSIHNKGYYGTGQSDDGYHTDFYRYDPQSDTWEEVTSFPGEPRSAAVSFVIDSLAYVGTGHKIGEALNDFYVYNPTTDSWNIKSPVGGSIRQDAMAFAVDGKGYIGTGNDNLGNDFRDIWEYDAPSDTWIQIDDFIGQKRRYAVAFVVNNTPYIAGGTDGTNFKDLWAFAPSLSILEQKYAAMELSIYPNPSSQFIKINFGSSKPQEINATYTITDLSGRTYLKGIINGNTIVFNKTHLESGTFLFNVYYNHTIVATKKFIFN